MRSAVLPGILGKRRGNGVPKQCAYRHTIVQMAMVTASFVA
jgi:hypothetical protein